MKHLRTRVLIEILIPTLAVFLLISITAYILYIDNYRDSVIEKKQAEFLNVSRLFSDWISSRIRDLIFIAASEQYSEDDIPLTREYLRAELTRRTYPFDELWLIDRNGAYWNTSGRRGSLPEGSRADLLFRGDKLFLYLYPRERKDQYPEPYVLFGIPVSRNGRVVSLLAGSVRTAELNWLLKLYTYRMFDSTALIDLQTQDAHDTGGVVIAHSDPEQNGRPEAAVYGNDISTNRFSKTESFFVTSLINNWKFIGRISNSNLYFQIEALSRFFMLILILLIIVISVLSIGISQLIARPVVELTLMANRMLKGDFNNTITVRTKDELDSLAQAFNSLNKQIIQLRTNDRFSFLGRISSRMAHEIRHPLHVIQIAVQTMTPANYPRNREIITQEIRKAEMFIREVLEIARPKDLSLGFYSLSGLAENLYKKYQLLEKERGVTLKLQLDGEKDSFYFDVLKIEQVLTNILNNSFEATPPGGNITLAVGNDPENPLTVTVTDTGPGFDPDNIDRIFDPYYTTKDNGTGLGLSICYQILTAHGAVIELSNRSGGGAVTKITFSSLPDSQ